MKRISLTLVIAAALAIFSAFTTTSQTQDYYVRIGPGSSDDSFLLVTGEKGVDWDCDETIYEVCSYVKLGPNSFQAFGQGELIILSR